MKLCPLVPPVPSTPERREGLRACYWEGPSELPERRSSSSAAKTRGFHTQLDEGPEFRYDLVTAHALLGTLGEEAFVPLHRGHSIQHYSALNKKK